MIGAENVFNFLGDLIFDLRLDPIKDVHAVPEHRGDLLHVVQPRLVIVALALGKHRPETRLRGLDGAQLRFLLRPNRRELFTAPSQMRLAHEQVFEL
jgi:hypothetical protein